MSESCFPFNSVDGDRVYKAEDFRNYFKQFIGNGVFYANSNALKVAENSGMTIGINAGAGWVDGAGYINDNILTKTLANADGVLNRIDRVVLRCSYTERKVYADVLQGSYSASPSAPALTRNADKYELALADIYVAAGVTSISQSNITDQRLNTTVCGIVTGLIVQADTTDIFNQFEEYLTEFKAQYIANIEDWTYTQETSFTSWSGTQELNFERWVESIKDILDAAAAGKLQNEIEAAAVDVFKRFYGMLNTITEFKPNGSIVATNDEATVTTTFSTDDDGHRTITETLVPTASGATSYTKITTIIPATETTNKQIREEYTTA